MSMSGISSKTKTSSDDDENKKVEDEQTLDQATPSPPTPSSPTNASSERSQGDEGDKEEGEEGEEGRESDTTKATAVAGGEVVPKPTNNNTSKTRTQQQSHQEEETEEDYEEEEEDDEDDLNEDLFTNMVLQRPHPGNHSNSISRTSASTASVKATTKRHLKELRHYLDTFNSADEKFKALSNRYTNLLHENKKFERELILLKRRCDQLAKEKDTLCLELTKANTMKQKLEGLCRELQKQNKVVMEDSKRITHEEHKKREDMTKKFQLTMREITTKMEEQGDKQAKDNDMLREKLKNFAEQYEIREQHFLTQLKTKDLERQLLEAKLKQQMEIAAQEALKAQAYKEQITFLAKTESELRAQLSLYAEKFEQFQDTLTKSNDVFTTFKQEMERMTKTIKKSEKENSALRKKCEQTDYTLIELAEERNNYRKQVESLTQQKKQLEALCRALQTERNKNRNVEAATTNANGGAANPFFSQ